MKSLFLLIGLSLTAFAGQAQDQTADKQFVRQRIKPAATYQTSFHVSAGRTKFLNVRLRKRLSAATVLKASLPLIAASTYGLLKQK